jgi:dGTPase
MPRFTRGDTREDPSQEDLRTPYQRDRDRILYSSAFRRLGGVTQVISAAEGLIVHNRLTHTLKVAQIARRLAERLPKRTSADIQQAVGEIDADVAEAAALAHDLGHPPFGHIAEEELDTIASDEKTIGRLGDGFEGNAQSFRIVSRQSVRTYHYDGLNLTRATLNAILKYPWLRDKGPKDKSHRKWGAYEEDAAAFEFAREESNGIVKSPEAEIMDWADDITYALHDTEDFYRAGLIPLNRLAPGSGDQERLRFLRYYVGAKKISDSVQQTQSEKDLSNAIGALGPQEAYVGSVGQRHTLRGWISNRIGAYISEFQLRVPTADDPRFVAVSPRAERELDLLKHLTWFYVIKNPALATQQAGQRRMIRELFKIFHDCLLAGNDDVLPVVFADRARKVRDEALAQDDAERRFTRIVVDLIASMTETQAVRIYHKLTGIDPGSALDQLLHHSIG